MEVSVVSGNATTAERYRGASPLFSPQNRVTRSLAVLSASNRSKSPPWRAHWLIIAVPVAAATRQRMHVCPTLHFPQAAAR